MAKEKPNTFVPPTNEDEALSRKETYLEFVPGSFMEKIQMDLLEQQIFGKEDEKYFGKKKEK